MNDQTIEVSPLRNGALSAFIDWQGTAIEAALRLQHDQLQMISAWQRMAAEFNQDAWDRWTCRFGGGVPLDG
ncbi:MAG: hypothetical protein KKC79_21070 [Gammaproteobacteria bacterium]|nr:hypothetical protein [Gammaproteobacteria bacterium]MBU1442131.1 hypothetical protein [Gammaproteobacteria bacterium]MBU2288287.1 hypothetical protein [Gammaproteobacteria bacterium]MBU2411130.1 hypothetical protein [Gammaproteobacteria bacterium]